MTFKDIFSKLFKGNEEPEYIEIDLGQSPSEKTTKVLVRPFVLKKFDDTPEILNSLREGYTIAIIDMKPLKDKDIIELKRAVSKIRKTAEALEGNVAGFGENIIIVTPNFAEIYKPNKAQPPVSMPAPSPTTEFEKY
jgi:SepF-like predicted cell division protein (DUF552 family)